MVSIRPLKSSDKEQIVKLADNKNVWDNLKDHMPFPYKKEEADNFVQNVMKEDPVRTFAIEYDGEVAGIAGIVLQENIYRKTGVIGYWVGEPFWGKGIATKAIGQITEYGFKDLKLMRIHAGIFDYNLGSMKVLEKNGYKKDGIFRKSIIKNGIIYDEHRFFKLKDM